MSEFEGFGEEGGDDVDPHPGPVLSDGGRKKGREVVTHHDVPLPPSESTAKKVIKTAKDVPAELERVATRSKGCQMYAPRGTKCKYCGKVHT